MSKTTKFSYECRLCGRDILSGSKDGLCRDCRRDEKEAMIEMEWDSRRDEERLMGRDED